MMKFKLFKNTLYLYEAQFDDPSQARVGFLFQNATRTDSEFDLTQETWASANNKGFFAFFEPSATRDWSSFANQVRALFEGNKASQFGWFAESETGEVSAITLVFVGAQGTGEPFVQQAFTLTFNNSALQVQGSPFQGLRNTISYDDASNAFQVANPNASTIQLTTQAPHQSRQTFTSTSANLILPMDDGVNPHAGSVNVDFKFRVQDLAAFEAGFMYFGPGEAQVLAALNYPVFRPAEANQSTMAFSVWLDVLQPLVDTRSYFQFKDAVVGSYFTTPNGKAFALHPTNGGLATTSRFAFANRPINSPTDADTYYLTPVGIFGIALDTDASGNGSGAANSADLLCGVTGTEFLTASLAANADPIDQLQFEAGQPAFQKVTASREPGGVPTFLSDEDGNVTTSWVRLQSSTGVYVSQPQGSPLYNQNGNGAATLKGEVPASGLSLYLLDFLPLPTWKADGATMGGDGASEATAGGSPLVPLVPYAGLLFNTNDQADPYLQIESDALNPTRKNAFTDAQATLTAQARARGETLDIVAAEQLTYAMTPQGLLAGLTPQQVWQDTQFAISPALDQSNPDVVLQFTEMGDQIRQALQQNQVFLTISTLTDSQNSPLFQFTGQDQTINIAGWPFSLSPAGTATSDGTPPIVMVKLYPGRSIADLVDDISLWSQPDVFNGSTFTAKDAQAYLQKLIQDACEAVYGEGNCSDGTPSGQPDTNSLYYNFYQVVTNPAFNGLLAVNCNMQLNALPTAIRAVIGGMTDIESFRVHHVGVSINDTSDGSTPALSQSSLFGLVDYEKPTTSSETAVAEVGVDYNFEVEYLRALFTNSALSSFSCKINLTINNLFGTEVTKQDKEGVGAAESNVVVITGSYQAHSTSGDDDTSGQGVYSFIAEGNFNFKFTENPYLDNITLTKLQFSFDQETPDATNSDTSLIEAAFGIWGNLVFKQFDVLDIFSFEKLVFNDLGISVSFDLTVPQPPTPPSTANLSLKFSPGNLRLDLGNTTEKQGSNSLLSLLPFKLKSFLYNQYPDKQTVEDLKYFALSDIPLDPGFKLVNKFNYALLFDLDLGTLGALVGSLEAFKFSFLIGWLTDDETGGIAFGVQLPEADGKLEIKIEGVLELSIETFILKYVTPDSGGDAMLVVGLNNSYLKLLGQRLPPGNAFFDFALFAPTSDASRIGWIAAINNQSKDAALEVPSDATAPTTYEVEVGDANGENGENGDSKVFELIYLGGGQRVGPKPDDTPTNFADFLKWMTDTFWEEFKKGEYDKVYDPDGQWLAVADFKLLGIIEVGFIFYDVTPFYSLVLNVDKLFNFEITYTKISDSIGLFYANFSLPDSLRTFQVGAASLTLPAIGVSVYTNGNWKLDVGFPKNDDWSRSFRVQAQAGPVPVTGSGGFYIASLSSATAPDIFTGEYPSILAFGFAARLGVGKDFTSGPLKAGVSVTFFGIIEGAAGYLASGSTEIFQEPDALSLKGQFGIIGELYGSVDFVIIKASVNVRLQASVGIVLKFERSIPNSGEILLYIEASVSVSVKVKINLGLFSISISFSFKASFRFGWKLLKPGTQSSRMMLHSTFAAMPAITPTVLPLCTGFTADLPLWFLPEGTVVFPAATGTGVPWVVTSIGIEYDPEPSGTPTYAEFKPFEKLTTQLVTWALANVLGEMSDTFTVTQDQLNVLDQTPETLVDWIDYGALLEELAVFKAAVTVPTADPGDTLYGTPFPMPPFVQLKTDGRLDSSDKPDDLDFAFSSKNNVPERYIEEVDAYFNQLFVNQTQSVAPQTLSADANIPLIQSVFLNYFKGLIRGGVHQLLETMQNEDLQSAKINELIPKAVGAGQFASLSGQMSSSFRGGVRLPYTDGLTVPGGDALKTTNPMYALLWQEFPAGSLDAEKKQYTIGLTNPDSSQTWLTASVSWALTSEWLEPFQTVQAGDIQAPSQPQQLPFTDIGPAAFAYENAIVWTQPDNKVASLRSFPDSLLTLMQQVAGAISMLVESRAAGAPYLPGGTPLDPSTFTWATQIQLTLKQVPANETNGAKVLPDIFSMSGASQQDQALLEQIIRVINENPNQNPIASIQVLYQMEAGASGLTSKTVNPSDVFALRTNTTTVTAPPVTANLLALEATAPPEVPVGATLGETVDFLQIIQQAAVTNAPGYYLRYLDTDGKSLPTDLFQGNPAPVTLLITYAADGGNTASDPAQIKPFYNAIVLDDAVASLVYYAETTDPALYTQYSAVAPGSVGVVLTRSDTASLIQPHQELVAAGLLDTERQYDHADLLKALVDSGMDNETEIRAALADAGAAASQLNELYSLITYQVEATTGFVQSNLSAPVQPQQPDEASSAADGLTNTDDDTRSYRIYAPLYALAEANQGQSSGAILNRYVSINDPVAIDIFQNDAFGNQMPASDTLKFTTTNLYFDPILPLDQWQGVVTAYDFRGTDGTPEADSFTIYLNPTGTAFADMSEDQAEAALQNWTTIQDQINGEGVSFFVETNLALDADVNLVQVTLDQTQADAIKTMVDGIVVYLQTFTTPPPTFDVKPVAITTKVSGATAVPPVFEVAVLFGIQRDPSLISPLLKDGNGNITFPSAQFVQTQIVPTVGASVVEGGASISIDTFADAF
ncbi:MAG TPA: hypothetical protein VKP65_22960, partial [Rhodothermales bacterium]|nr:hypothetical protein [Rhodothermales bacterium]